jgi:hypothetical protein
MTLGRTWRTLRHVPLPRIAARLDRRGRQQVARMFPRMARAGIDRAAAALALPDPTRAALLDVAGHVGPLQDAVHGAHLDGIPSGRFTILNHALEFDGPAGIDWGGDFGTGDLGTGDDALVRMTLGYMGFAVPLLARGDADNLALVADILRSLEDGNPWHRPGVFRGAWNPYTASHRVINLLSGLALHATAGGDPQDPRAMEIAGHVRFCAAYIRRNLEYDLGYNHLLKNLVALAVYGAGIGGVPPQWDFLAGAVRAVLGQTVLADGGHAERSPMYHLLGLGDVRMLGACKLFGEDLGALLAETANRMAAALGTLTHPDGDIALFNDSWRGEGPLASELAGQAPAEITRLPDTGYVRLGGGGDGGGGGDAMIFDCGACGPDDNPAHAHADFLAIEVSVAHRRLIVDPGVASYAAGEARDECRAAASHNGPRVAGLEPIEFWRAFRVGHRARAGEITDPGLDGAAPLWCAGRHDGLRDSDTVMRRYVGLWPGSALLICDVWMGTARSVASSQFLIPATWRVVDTATLTFAAEDTRIDVRVEVRVEMQALAGHLEDVAPARHWERFGVAAPAHGVTLVAEVGAEAGESHRRAALWLEWGEGATRPDTAALDALFRRLIAAA